MTNLRKHQMYCGVGLCSPEAVSNSRQGASLRIKYMYVCQLCKDSFVCKENCVKHFQTHIRDKQQRCLSCGNTFRQIGLSSKYISSRNKKQCGICTSLYAKVGDAKKVKAKSKKILASTYVGMSDVKAVETVINIKREGLEEEDIELEGTAIGKRLYVCYSCGRDFNGVTAFNDHQHQGCSVVKQDQAILGEELHGCDVCGDNFPSLSSLNNHRCLHGIDNPENSDDQVTEATREPVLNSLKKEIESHVCNNIGVSDNDADIKGTCTSTGEGLFVCHPCEEEFHSIPVLDEHRRHCIEQSDGNVPQSLSYLGPCTEPEKNKKVIQAENLTTASAQENIKEKLAEIGQILFKTLSRESTDPLARENVDLVRSRPAKECPTCVTCRESVWGEMGSTCQPQRVGSIIQQCTCGLMRLTPTPKPAQLDRELRRAQKELQKRDKTNLWPESGIRDQETMDLQVNAATTPPNNSNEKSNFCGVCGKNFLRKYDLKLHERIHTGEKPYSCAACGQAFSRKKALKNHAKWHEDIHVDDDSMVVGKNGYGTNHFHEWINRAMPHPHTTIGNDQRCFSDPNEILIENIKTEVIVISSDSSDCDEVIKNLDHLTGRRRLICEHCGKICLTRKRLRGHKRIHTGEKPYVCGKCGQAFRRKKFLRKHIRTSSCEDVCA